MTSWSDRIAGCMRGRPEWNPERGGWLVSVVDPAGAEIRVVASSPMFALLKAYHLIEERLIREMARLTAV